MAAESRNIFFMVLILSAKVRFGILIFEKCASGMLIDFIEILFSIKQQLLSETEKCYWFKHLKETKDRK